HSIDWLWGRPGLDLWCAIPVDADRIAGLDVIEPAECHSVTSLGALALSCLLPEQRGYPTDAVLAVWTYYRRAIGDFAGQDACQGQLAAVGRVDAFEDVSGGGSTLNPEPRRRGLDKWSLVTERLEQPENAIAALGRSQQHRADQPLAQLPGEVVENLVPRRLHVGEELFHQLVIIVRQLLEHVEAGFLLPFQ